jgi:anaphase-promoting complex subunit 4
MGWSSNVANKKSSSVKQKKISVWQDHFSEGDYTSKDKAALDLPRDLAMIDIEISLPKLSVLANGGSS